MICIKNSGGVLENYQNIQMKSINLRDDKPTVQPFSKRGENEWKLQSYKNFDKFIYYWTLSITKLSRTNNEKKSRILLQTKAHFGVNKNFHLMNYSFLSKFLFLLFFTPFFHSIFFVHHLPKFNDKVNIAENDARKRKLRYKRFFHIFPSFCIAGKVFRTKFMQIY